jgi:3,4-dihydroxy-9,10-secoandrosta-1,3,5(10)-triene-9,17-dione 4,5-dioxygenase
VTSLGYVVVSGDDLGSWRHFAETVLGLQIAAGPGQDKRETLRFRMDQRAWRLAVEKGPDGGLVALGFEVTDREALARLRTRFTDEGMAVKDSPELTARRQVLGLLQVCGPSGHPLEFYYGAASDSAPFVSATGVRFVTGAQGLGHAVLIVDDEDAAYDFYIRVLGFRVSDVLALGPVSSYFTSPNARHHSLAFVAVPGARPMLQHIMLEVDNVDGVGRAFDRVLDTGVPVARGLGRHTNDRMLSFYCDSPSGLQIEYGFGGRQIDDASHTTDYYQEASTWGHRPPDGYDPLAALHGT